jgi:Fur family transcriptional regulator, ferric uptake regulator
MSEAIARGSSYDSRQISRQLSRKSAGNRIRMTRVPPSSSELKSIGLKATLPRLKVLEIFQRSSEDLGVRHMSAEDVYKALMAEHIDVGLATVYRVLTQFEQAGLLARNHFEGGRAMFELNEGTHHDHLVCLTCGRVEEFVDSEIENRRKPAARYCRGARLPLTRACASAVR